MTVRLGFSGELWYWRGPAPWYFVTVPEEQCHEVRELSGRVSYGWGMIPVVVTIGESTWRTSLFPKDGRYVVPIKAWVREKESMAEGELTEVQLTIET